MDTEIQVLNHEGIVKLVTEFLVDKPDGNWHKERIRKADLHAHGADLVLVGGKRNSEYFIIECKGKSSASSANSINKEGWLLPSASRFRRTSCASPRLKAAPSPPAN